LSYVLNLNCLRLVHCALLYCDNSMTHSFKAIGVKVLRDRILNCTDHDFGYSSSSSIATSADIGTVSIQLPQALALQCTTILCFS
jgi:hypothetical protein